MSGKGDKRRPLAISKEEEDIRWQLAFCDDPSKAGQLKKRLEEIMNANSKK